MMRVYNLTLKQVTLEHSDGQSQVADISSTGLATQAAVEEIVDKHVANAYYEFTNDEETEVAIFKSEAEARKGSEPVGTVIIRDIPS